LPETDDCESEWGGDGLGATLALFCDIIFAANHAKIADPHVKVGFVAGDGGPSYGRN